MQIKVHEMNILQHKHSRIKVFRNNNVFPCFANIHSSIDMCQDSTILKRDHPKTL